MVKFYISTDGRDKRIEIILCKRSEIVSESKSTKERQHEILDAANELFAEKGYDATSVSDIMKKVGIAKGTLYYHFSSKEEILDALIERITDEMVQRARKVREDKELSVVQRMVGVICAINVSGHGDGDILATLHIPQNALFHQKSYELTIKKVGPIMTDLVKEGIEQGIFKTNYPKAAVHMALTYALVAFENPSELYPDLIQGFIYNLERLLDTSEGTFDEFYKCF